MSDDVEEFLAHYGVLGMKWGVRKDRRSKNTGPSQRQKRLENKIAAQKAVTAKSGVRIKEIREELNSLPKNAYAKRLGLSKELKYTRDLRNRSEARVKSLEKGRSGLTQTQKNLLIGAAAVGAVVAGGYILNKAGGVEAITSAVRRARDQARYGEMFKTKPHLARTDLKPNEVLRDVVKGINPNYARQGGMMNCRRTTFAYELRRRGYDVVATTAMFGRGQSETGLTNALIRGDRNRYASESLSSMIVRTGSARAKPIRDDRKYTALTKTVKATNELRKAIMEQPEGARGEIVFDMGRFGHSMAYERFGNTAKIFDSQKGVMYHLTEAGLDKLQSKWGVVTEMEITRLDDVDLDLEFLSRWAKSA